MLLVAFLLKQKAFVMNISAYDTLLWILSGCLNLLPPEQLEQLDLPANEESKSSVKKLVYLSDNNLPYVGGNTTFSRQLSEGSRFNLFTGDQTFDQREKSFKVMNNILTVFLVIGEFCYVNCSTGN